MLWSQSGKKLNAMVIGGHEQTINAIGFIPEPSRHAMFVQGALGGKRSAERAKRLSLVGAGGADETMRVWKWDKVYGSLVKPISHEYKVNSEGARKSVREREAEDSTEENEDGVLTLREIFNFLSVLTSGVF